MEELMDYKHDDDSSSRRTTVSVGGVPPVAALEPGGAAPRGQGMRIKNLDTGEEYDLEEFTSREQSNTGPNPYQDAEPMPTLEEEDAQPKVGKKKIWLKGTKKLKTWAKSTISNVREKIEERIERQHALRQHQQQSEAAAQGSQGGCVDGESRRGGTSGGGGTATEMSEGGTVAPGALAGKESFDWAAGAATASEGGYDSTAVHRRTHSSQDSSLASTSTSAAVLTGPSNWRAVGPPALTSEDEPPGEPHAAAPDNCGHAMPVSTAATALEEGSRPPPPPRPPVVPPLPVGSHTGSGGSGVGVSGLSSSATGAAGAAKGGGSAVGGGSVGSLIPLSEPGAQQQSEELRVPLLEEDVAGSSSRAVPTARSWLNQPARVIGARRPAGRQMQQVRMIQELYGHDGVVWAMKFSADARLLATAGRDGVLRVWSVYWYPQDRSKLISVNRDSNPPFPASSLTAATASFSAPGPAPPASASTSYTSSSGVPGPAPPAGSASVSPAASRPPLLSESPLLSLAGHRGDLLDLSWSQCRLLLTASADQTARLWYIDVDAGGAPGGGGGGGGAGGPVGECLRSFVHPDFVTTCCFHTGDPRRIVTGCADGKIRIWSVPDASVLATATVPQDLITRVVFSSDGSRVVGGTLRSKACYYEFTGSSLDYLTQLDVKNAHGAGRKVTGIVQVPYTYGNDQLYVITTADSRIRLYVGYTQERKFKGHRNTNTQIAASLSPSCHHLICGSDDGWVYIWETGLVPPPPPAGQAHTGVANSGASGSGTGGPAAAPAAGSQAGRGRSRAAGKDGSVLRGLGGKVKESSYEAFQTPESTTTVALFAPSVCRLGRGFERLEGTSGQGAAAAASLLGSLFVVAGFSGRIYVYENLPL